jgi:hypothetical protein
VLCAVGRAIPALGSLTPCINRGKGPPPSGIGDPEGRSQVLQSGRKHPNRGWKRWGGTMQPAG